MKIRPNKNWCGNCNMSGKNGSVGPDNLILFFQPKHRYWLSLRFTSINFMYKLLIICENFETDCILICNFFLNVVLERVGQVTVNTTFFRLVHEKK